MGILWPQGESSTRDTYINLSKAAVFFFSSFSSAQKSSSNMLKAKVWWWVNEQQIDVVAIFFYKVKAAFGLCSALLSLIQAISFYSRHSLLYLRSHSKIHFPMERHFKGNAKYCLPFSLYFQNFVLTDTVA